MTDQADVQVAHDGLIVADFEMREAQFAFLVLQGAFDGPARETDVQPGCEGVFQWVPDEKPFFFFGVQRIVSPKEVVTAENVAVTPQPERGRLDFPDQRSFLRVLDVERRPALACHRPGVPAKFLDAAGRMTWLVAGVVEPARQIPRNFHDIATLPLFQAGQEIGPFGVPDIGGDPFEMDAVGLSTIEEFEANAMLGPIDKIVGNARLATAFAVVAPDFGEEEFGIEHGPEACVVGTEGKLNGDDAVGNLTEPAAILALHAGSLVARFGMAGVVDDADGLGIFMIASDHLLDAVASTRMVPNIGAQKLLERPWGDAVEQRDGLDALALQIAELPAHVMAEMSARLGSSEAVGELVQVLG